MADELSLPRLTRDNTSTIFAKTNLSRKRVRNTPPPDSSDPPIFSSDDDPSVEKYTQKRRKQRFRGPWFDQQLASDSAFEDELLDRKAPIKNKRTFNRKVDSGVFMGSDGTDIEDIDMDAGSNVLQANSVVVPLPFKSRITLDTPRDIHAQRKIEKCLEDGEEYIDLSLLALDHLENSTIRPLSTFVKTAGGYTSFEPSLRIILSGNLLTKLPAELFNLNRLVFLSLRANKLKEIPSGIGKLEMLEDLNISQNQLGYLPYEIVDLLAGGTLYGFQLHPNPFYMPMERSESAENGAKYFEIDLHRKWPSIRNPPFLHAESSVSFEVGNLLQRRLSGGNPNAPRPSFPENDSPPSFTQGDYPRNLLRDGNFAPAGPGKLIKSEKWSLSYQFRTEVRFFNLYGQCIKGPVFPSDPQWEDSGRPVKLPVAKPDDIPVLPAVQSRVQSLMEKILQSCSRSPEVPDIESYMGDDIPPRLPSLLRKAENVNYSGPTKCTICKRSFIVPRTEWIEWWEIEKISPTVSSNGALDIALIRSTASPLGRLENERDTAEKLVPLIRRGCSWLCLPPHFPDRLPQLPLGEDDDGDVGNEVSMDTEV